MSIARARTLRTTMTDAERTLWKLLRMPPFDDWKFRRQHTIGKFIADFACVDAALVIEVDGGQHCESAYDAERSAWSESCGWRVVRFWNNDVLQNTNGVAETLLLQLLPLPDGRGRDPARKCREGEGSSLVLPSPGHAVPAWTPSPIGERGNQSAFPVQGEVSTWMAISFAGERR